MHGQDEGEGPDGAAVDEATTGDKSATKPIGQQVGPPGTRVDDETPASGSDGDDAKRTHRQE